MNLGGIVSGLFGNEFSKLEGRLNDAGNTMRLKAEIADSAKLPLKDDGEKRKYVGCVGPHLIRLLDGGIVHEDSISRYIELCSELGIKMAIEQVMERLHIIMRRDIKAHTEKPTIDMASSSMARTNWYNSLCKKVNSYADAT